MELFLAIYSIGFLVVILASIYMDVDHYKAYKSLPDDPNLLIGSITGVFWPIMLIIFGMVLISSWFGIVYNKLIGYLAK